MSIVGLRATFTELFTCPISHEIMTDPVINPCGHTFERTQIDGWIASKISANQPPQCPLCRAPIQGLLTNILIKQALDVLNNPNNSRASREEDLTTEEQEQLKRACSEVKSRRVTNQQRGIPNQLPEPLSFPRRVIAACSSFYSC